MRHSCLISIHWEDDQDPTGQIVVMGEFTKEVLTGLLDVYQRQQDKAVDKPQS